MNLEAISINGTVGSSSPISSIATATGISSTDTGEKCHGFVYQAVLVAASIVFVVYLIINVKKNVIKLWNRRSYIMISYYALLWVAGSLNLLWSSLQVWQCSPGKEVSWNLVSMLTGSAMLFMEISIVAFLLQDSYSSGLEALSRTFAVSGIIVTVDMLFKAVYIFGFGVQLFIDTIDSTQKTPWGLWIVHMLLLTAVYGYILFVHFSKWKEKSPPRPAFYNYIIVMFSVTTVQLFACGLAVAGAGFGIWLYSFIVLCYHCLYLPFLYLTFLADFFQEEEFLLDNAYYSEMRDAGFFDADWD